MYKRFRVSAFVLCIVMLAGCAGTDFVRPSTSDFKMRQTTRAQVVLQLGEPRREGEVLKNEKNVKSITYAYATTGGEPLEEGVIAARAMNYYFLDGLLVGQEFVSSFKSDNSNFDDSRIASIVKGKTTRSEVNQLLGRPSGSYVPPMVKATSGEAVGYTYTTVRGGVLTGFKLFRKALLISFDAQDQVSDVEYSSSSNK
jgi:hypothetical protein